MKYLVFVFIIGCFVMGCSIKKPPLAPTQIVDGKSIIIPPEMDKLPQVTEQTNG